MVLLSSLSESSLQPLLVIQSLSTFHWEFPCFCDELSRFIVPWFKEDDGRHFSLIKLIRFFWYNLVGIGSVVKSIIRRLYTPVDEMPTIYSCRSTYAAADPQTGLRYIYYAKVLVGEYTEGNSRMIVAPKKNTADPNKLESLIRWWTMSTRGYMFHIFHTMYIITLK